MNSDLGKSTAVCQPWFTTQMDLIPGVGWSDQRWLCKRLESLAHDPQSVREFGIDVVTRLCQRLLEHGAPGLHFYTMNSAEPVRTIWTRLGLG
jgi:5,10-methylenetetrahydrofolate reductase